MSKQRHFGVFTELNTAYEQTGDMIDYYTIYRVFEHDKDGEKIGDCLYEGKSEDGDAVSYALASVLIDQDMIRRGKSFAVRDGYDKRVRDLWLLSNRHEGKGFELIQWDLLLEG